jgi:hypothetical protein
MSGLSRHDFFRVLLPGGALLFLIDLATRILASAQGIKPGTLEDLRKVLEDPFSAVAIAFGMGLLLYLVDPGYGAPQYYVNLPSTHLAETMRKRGMEVDEVSLYLVLADSLLPPALQDRALFYGAVYRIGFQIIIYGFLTAALIPISLLLLLPANADVEFEPSYAAWGGVGVVVAVASLPWIRTGFRRGRSRPARPRPIGKWFAMSMLVLILMPTIAWLNLAWNSELRWSHEAAGLSSTMALLSWVVLRLSGPLGPRFRHLRGVQRKKPDEPHSQLQIALLDLVVVVPALIGVMALDAWFSFAGTWGVCLLSAGALLLAFLRKHERQLYGIYRNQNLWIDSHLEQIVDEFSAVMRPFDEERHPGPPKGQSPARAFVAASSTRVGPPILTVSWLVARRLYASRRKGTKSGIATRAGRR